MTNDPYRLTFGGRKLYVDLGAERVTVAAERGVERIAVEVQSFVQDSDVKALQEAAGQYGTYRLIMAELDPDRRLYMAVPRWVADEILSEPIGALVVRGFSIKVMVFDDVQERVLRWIE